MEEELFDPGLVPKSEVKFEEEEDEHGDAWLAESCLEPGEVAIKKEENLDQDENEECVATEESPNKEDGEVQEPCGQRKSTEDLKLDKALKHLRSTKCKVTLLDCLKAGQAGTWLKARGSIVVSRKAENSCFFTCSVCDKIVSSLAALKIHTRKNGCAGHVRLSSASAHICVLCSKVLLCDATALREHYRKSHKKDYLRCLRELAKDQAPSKMMSPKEKQKVLKKYPLSEIVGNLCSFECDGCHKVFSSLSHFILHNNDLKAKGLPPCSTKKWPDIVKKAVAHRCVLCSDLVLCDNSALLVHLVRHGGMKVAEYSRKHLGQVESAKSERLQRLRAEIPSIPSFGFKKVLPPESIAREMVTDLVENLCIYKCKCSYSCNSFISMRFHGKQCKEESITHSNPVRFVVEGRYHRCRVCAKRILCDKRFIICHVDSAHFLNREGYASLTGSGEQLEASRKEEEALWESELFTKVPAVEPDKHSMSLQSSHLPVKTTDEIRNLCKFRCRAISSCSFTASSLESLKYHTKMSHKGRRYHYDPSSLVEARYHRCSICSKSILCDRHVIGGHVRGHGADFNTYEARTQQKGWKEKSRKQSKKQTLLFPERAIPQKYVTTFPTNACTFTCPHCEHRVAFWDGMWRHVGRCSGVAKVSPKYVTEARYHKCLICSRLMLCDNGIILRHVAAGHGMTMKTYMSRTKMKRRPTKAEVDTMLRKVPSDSRYWQRVEN